MVNVLINMNYYLSHTVKYVYPHLENEEPEYTSNLVKTTQLLSDKAETGARTCLCPESSGFSCLPHDVEGFQVGTQSP